MSNVTTTQTAQPKPWMLAVDFVEAPELVEAKRDSDGRFLRRNVSLNVKTATQSASNIAMANLYGCDADEIFAGRR